MSCKEVFQMFEKRQAFGIYINIYNLTEFSHS